MVRDGRREQQAADANRAAKKVRQDVQRARDDKRRADIEKERKRLETRRLQGGNLRG